MLYRQDFDPVPCSKKYLILLSLSQLQVTVTLLRMHKMKILRCVHTLHQKVEGVAGQPL